MAMTGSLFAVLATLLAALVANLQSLRQRATAIAERMTGELAASNERFGLAIAGTNDGIWDWDLKARRLWGSPRCRQMLGYDEAALPDEPAAWRSLMLPEDQEATRAAFERVRNGTAPSFDVIQRYRHKDGRVVHLHNQAFAVRDGKGRLTRLVGALTDVTPLVQAQEQLRAAISVMKDGFGLFDADDRIVLHNEAFIDEGTRKILGATSSAARSRRFCAPSPITAGSGLRAPRTPMPTAKPGLPSAWNVIAIRLPRRSRCNGAETAGCGSASGVLPTAAMSASGAT